MSSRYPYRQPLTLGQLVEKILDAPSREDVCDVLDEDFLLGPWGYVLDPETNTEHEIRPNEMNDLCKNIRGLVWSLVRIVKGIPDDTV